ncbi:uncharacterized protein LOC115990625 [Quercus lobata]|uniref:uncharacterized protein LOC115990625 n=1 Tax=Quercus lobata TaxID=97700 RepID=UPI001248C7C5|nr:uncharacterized protein LOC115990625 [Quercus lobata]
MVAMCLVKDPGKRRNLLKHTFFKHAKSLEISLKDQVQLCKKPELSVKTIPTPSLFPNFVFVKFFQFFILTKFPFPFSYTDDMELDDAVQTAILMLKEGFEGQISSINIGIGIIGTDKKFGELTPAEIDDI